MSDAPERRWAARMRACIERTNWFHTDACLCGLSAIALNTNAPTLLRREAAMYATGAPASGRALGRTIRAHGRAGVRQHAGRAVEKAIVANCAAVREWDSNGTNFGYNPRRGRTIAGEFGHNDFYPSRSRRRR
jgi:2-methylcitrate dehydratase